MLEAMEEKQTTVEGKTFKMSPDFFVMATQNPQDYEGTFPLPEAQQDRFLLKVVLGHSDIEVEQEILKNVLAGRLPPRSRGFRFHRSLTKERSDCLLRRNRRPAIRSGLALGEGE